MSELTKRLREPIPADVPGIVAERAKAADRIGALEECLRECVYCLEHDVTVERSIALLNKARALLEAHD